MMIRATGTLTGQVHTKSFWSGLLGLFLLVFSAQAQPVAAQQAQQETVDEHTKAVNYSLYYEYFKNGDYEAALPYLRWMIQHAPEYAGPGRKDDRNFERIIKVHEELAKASDDPEIARAHLDSALAYFDMAMEVLPARGVELDTVTWYIRRGRLIQRYPELLADRQQEAFEYYRKAFELAPERVDDYSIQVVIAELVREGHKEEAVAFMDQVEAALGADPERASLMEYITTVRDNLFQTPEERMAFLEDRLAKDSTNLEIISELFDIYRQLGEREKMYQLAERLLALKKDARTYHMVGKLYLDDGEPAKALEYFRQAMQAPGVDEIARELYYNAGVAEQQLGRLANARTYFRRALRVDPNFGKAYIAIGDLYAQAVAECGSQLEREDRAVYWLAVDYYEKARRVDPSVANEANRKINTYRKYFPDQEALFFKGWKVGQPYKIDYGCYAWINEETTVKPPPSS